MSGIRAVWCAVIAAAVALTACAPAGPGARTPSPSPTAPPSATTATAPPTPRSSATPSTTTSTPSTTVLPSTTPTPRPPSPPPTTKPTPSRSTPSPPAALPSACTVTARYLGDDLEVIPTSRRVVALTFDAGASSTGVASIMATLKREGVPATFFLTGDFVREHPASTRAIAAAHPVGNHTENHRDLTTLSSSAVVDEVRTGAATIRATTGRSPAPWFRFPFGARDDRTIRLVNEECYVAVRWTVDSLGWKGTSGGMSTEKVRDRVLSATRPGMVVLMHVGANPDDGTTLDAAALPSVIAGLRAKGYTFVSLPQAL